MRLVTITPPAEEPVTAALVKAHDRIDASAEDVWIESQIIAVRNYLEEILGRALVTRTLELQLDGWPVTPLKLPRPPLIAISSITYIPDGGTALTVPADTYLADTTIEPGQVHLAWNKSWPSAVLGQIAPVRIRFTAGYGAAYSVPHEVKLWMCQAVSWLYENREHADLGKYPIGMLSHLRMWR